MRQELAQTVGQMPSHPENKFLSAFASLREQSGVQARAWFAEQIRARWPKIKIIQPQPGKSIEV
jgi:hypothetical protein